MFSKDVDPAIFCLSPVEVGPVNLISLDRVGVRSVLHIVDPDVGVDISVVDARSWIIGEPGKLVISGLAIVVVFIISAKDCQVISFQKQGSWVERREVNG